ncbi:MAG: T9SS type A sorting domain-containing protein [Bacteroidales bacterium]
MKRLLKLTGLLICISLSGLARAQNLKTDSIFNWGRTGWELPADMISDQEGNFYVTGSFSGEMTIGHQQIKSFGQRDIFLAKFNPEKKLIWAKSLGGKEDDNAYSLLELDGKIYLAGSFRDEIGFNNGTIKLKGKGLTDVFVAQLTPDGNLQWANPVLSSAPARKAFLAADKDHNLVMAGSSEGEVETSGTVIGLSGKETVWYTKFNNTGKLENSGYINGNGQVMLSSFCISSAGNLCFAGWFDKSLDVQGKNIISEGKTDGFVLMADTEGKPFWLNRVGGLYDDCVKCVASDDKGNLYVAGDFKYNIMLDKEYTARQNTDVFIIKYNTDGQIAWSRQMGTEGESYNTSTQLEMTGNGKFFVTGTFRGKLQNSPEVKTKGNSGNAFLARFDTDGNRNWAIGATSMNENKLWIRLNKKDLGLFISGYFSEDFSIGGYELKNQNYKDIFFGNLADCDLVPKAELGPDTSVCAGAVLKSKKNFKKYLWNTGETSNSIQVKEEGIYTLQTTDRYGCESSDTIKVNLRSKPVVELGPDTALCQGNKKIIVPRAGYTKYLWENGSGEKDRVVERTGKYRLQVTDSLGCTATDSILVKVNEIPEFLLTDNGWLDRDTITVEALIEEGDYHYVWSTGSNNAQFKISSGQLKEPAEISLTLSDKNLCSCTKSLLLKPNAFGGNNNDNDLNGGYRIYPNPGNGHFYIEPIGKSGIKQVEVFDPRGQLVKSITNVTVYPVEVNLTGKAKGTYLVQISDEKTAKEIKVVLE